ncbi:MAG: hypothetical protein GX801_11075 [Fibrobacter sp.]|nr:hypothetical protein [Fibrobacter sp.]
MKLRKIIKLCLWAWGINAFANDGLVSNYTFGAAPGLRLNSAWILSRGDLSNGVTRAEFKLSGNDVQLQNMHGILFAEDLVGVHDLVFADLTGAGRRTPEVLWRDEWILPAVGLDSNQHFLDPQGLLRINDISADAYRIWDAELPLPKQRISGLGVDKAQNLWVASGEAGLVKIPSKAEWNEYGTLLGAKDSVWLWYKKSTTLKGQKISDPVDTAGLDKILALAVDSVQEIFWLGTPQGLWRGTDVNGTLELNETVGAEPVTGIWLEKSNILVETSRRDVESLQTISQLFVSYDGGKNFAALKFADGKGKLQKKAYDSLEVSVSSVAFSENYIWAAVQGIENNLSGLLRIADGEATRWSEELDLKRESSSLWVWGIEAGVMERDVLVTAVSTVDIQDRQALIATTYGAGFSISVDEGESWRTIMNLAPIKGNLAEVRLTPSVMRGHGATAEIGYRLDKSDRVTIEILSYDMRRVRTIIKDSPRTADPIRSTVPQEDFWDGKDDFGNFVALGIYYVRVKPQKAKHALGKVMWLGDRP